MNVLFHHNRGTLFSNSWIFLNLDINKHNSLNHFSCGIWIQFFAYILPWIALALIKEMLSGKLLAAIAPKRQGPKLHIIYKPKRLT